MMKKNTECCTHRKKALIIATVSGFITCFEKNNIAILQELGYQVSLATNTEDDAVMHRLTALEEGGVIVHHIPFARSPFSFSNITAYKKLKHLMREGNYDLVHCHTPVGGVLGRIAAHVTKVPHVIYTAHGFHFYDGAPIKNWVIFYPIEKFLSRWTDVLVTITKEDYARARKKFSAKHVEYIPGVGIDCDKFVGHDRNKFRQEIGLTDSDKLILSVGELNKNKNHEVVIKAIASMKVEERKNIHYVIVGIGPLESYLQQLIADFNLQSKVHLMGYRDDVPSILAAADVYILPSLREGLNVSLMEAMASGEICLCGKLRGNVDLIEDNKFLFEPNDMIGILQKLIYALDLSLNDTGEIENNNQRKALEFDKKKTALIMKKIYKSML